MFQWYGQKFQYIADILGNKTSAQVEGFYNDNRELLDDVSELSTESPKSFFQYMESYDIEMSIRMEQYGLKEEIEPSDDEESKPPKFG